MNGSGGGWLGAFAIGFVLVGCAEIALGLIGLLIDRRRSR